MKHLLISTLILGSQLHAADALAKDEKPVPRPNIIFLLTDDQRDNTLGAMGHPFVKTPNLDALMHDSVRFKNAYIATPVCSPSRVSFFTGMPDPLTPRPRTTSRVNSTRPLQKQFPSSFLAHSPSLLSPNL